MRLEQSFDVAAPLGRVWETLIDVERVAPCLPGAAVTGREQDGSYDGTFSVKIGPTTASYAGKLILEHVDEAAHSATIRANGTDRRGQGGARATITSSLHPIDGAVTRVEVTTDYQITGRLARFGRGGMIEDIAEKLLREFAQRLQDSLAGGEAAGGDGGATGADAGGEAAGAAATPAPDAATPPASAPPAEPLQGGSVIASVLWDRARRNPPALVAVLAGLVLVLVLARRSRR
jgi:carbon monoxide dehydrogenase subunit G